MQTNSLDTPYIQAISSHPVHIVNSQGKISPSAFIPFCDFGGNMSAMGEKINQFEIPVCNKFKPKMLDRQLCYQVDVNEVIDMVDAEKAMTKGLVFMMDYNDDKQIKEFKDQKDDSSTNDLYDMLKQEHNKQEARIYVDTLGNKQSFTSLK